MRALETSEIARVSLDCFNHIVAQLDLPGEHFSKLLIYTASRVYEHCAQISQMSAYDIIRFQLVELMQEPDAIRQQITAAAYIKSRTYLSRSGIMRILAELRTGNYITMERGILLDINHLPRKYRTMRIPAIRKTSYNQTGQSKGYRLCPLQQNLTEVHPTRKS